MKLLSWSILLVMLIVGCKKEESVTPANNNSNTGSSSPISITGEFEGKEWNIGAATASSQVDMISPGQYMHSLVFSDSTLTNACGADFSSTVTANIQWFTNSKVIEPITGAAPFNFMTLVMVDGSGTFSVYRSVNGGSFTVSSVDTVSRTVRGEIDLQSNDSTFLSGEFTMRYCEW